MTACLTKVLFLLANVRSSSVPLPKIQPTLLKYMLCSTVWLLSVLFCSVQEQIGKLVGKNKPYLAYECIFDERELITYRIVWFYILMTFFKQFSCCLTRNVNRLKIKSWEFAPRFSVSSRVIRKASDQGQKKLWYKVVPWACLFLCWILQYLTLACTGPTQ